MVTAAIRALGLRGFARIADDERVDHRQRAEHRLGEAGRGQRHGLAGQPFQRAVRAHVDHGIEIVLQPEAERHQGVARRQGRIVIVGAAAPQCGRDRAASATVTLPKDVRAKAERAVAGHRDRSRLRPTPPRSLSPIRGGRLRKNADDTTPRSCRARAFRARAAARSRISAPRPPHTRPRSRSLSRASTLAGTSRPDRIAGPARRAGIVRHQHRDPPLRHAAWLCSFAQRRHAIGDRSIRSGSGRLAMPVNDRPSSGGGRILERDRAGQHAAVELGQHDMHRKIGRAKPARAVEPGGALGGGDDGLQAPARRPRRAAIRSRRRLAANAVVATMTEGASRAHRVAQEGRRLRVLQTRDEQRRGRKAARGQRLAKRVDRRNVRGQQHRAIEHDAG